MHDASPEQGRGAGASTRFCILTYGRTGSRMLKGLLDSHTMVRCHGELFGENMSSLAAPGSDAHRELQRERAADPAGFLERRAFDPGGARAVGVKILYRQLFGQWGGLLEALKRDRQVRVIHLIRGNGIKRFMSEQAIRFTGVHEVPADCTPPAIDPIAVHVPDLLASLAVIERESGAVRELFREHPLMEVTYEDLVGQPDHALARVQEFLGVPVERLAVNVRKVLPDDLRAVIANLDEVIEALRGTPFEHMLAEAR